MNTRQAVVAEPFKTAVREVELPAPAPNQILVQTEVSAISAGTELAVYTGTHQWLKDPHLPDWKFPFKPGYSAAGTVVAVGSDVKDWKPGERVSYPGNHAAAELLSLGPERGRWWRLPPNLSFEKAAVAVIARYGLGASIRAGLTLGRSATVLGLGIIGQICIALASWPPGSQSRRRHRRRTAMSPARRQGRESRSRHRPVGRRRAPPSFPSAAERDAAEIVADATGVPDAIPLAMSLAWRRRPGRRRRQPARQKAKEVNFYDDLQPPATSR